MKYDAWFGLFIVLAGMAIFTVVILGFMWCWNSAVPHVTKCALAEIDFVQAACLIGLATVFGGPRSFGSGSNNGTK